MISFIGLLDILATVVVYGFLGVMGLAVVFFIWASLVNLVIAFFGLDDPKRFVPAPELPASSAGFGWFLLIAAIVVANK
jgi:hypothetical protein